MATNKKASKKPTKSATGKAKPKAQRAGRRAPRDLRREIGDVKRAMARLNAWLEQAEGQLAGNVDPSAQLCLAVTELGDRNSVSVLSCNPPS